MDEKKAKNLSTVLIGLGVIFILLPIFGFGPDEEQAFIFLGIIFLFSALGARLMGERNR